MEDKKPLPAITSQTAPYWAATREHRLALPYCTACGKPHLYPRPLCPFCGVTRLVWRDACGRGTVYSYTIVQRPPNQAFAAETPYVVAIVALEEGPHLLSRIMGMPVDAVRIGLPVRVEFQDVTADVSLPVFVAA